jgi:PAS domain S-box-containing protein
MDNSKTKEQLIEEVASLRSQVDQLAAGQTREIEQMAAEMRRRFKDTPVGLCYFDAELRYLQINEFLAAVNGLPAEDHIGKSVSEVLPEIAAAGVEKELRGVLESGDPVIGGTVTAETPAHPGEEHTYVHDYYAIRSEDSEIMGVSCCVLDVTD